MLVNYSILALLFAWMSAGSIAEQKNSSIPPAKKTFAVNPAALDFDKDVKPIFEQHCNPCHFSGGKMYDKLPFDQASTIINHEEGILRRIKDAKEVEAIKEFVGQNKSVESHS